MWTPYSKKWGSTDPLNPVDPRPLYVGKRSSFSIHWTYVKDVGPIWFSVRFHPAGKVKSAVYDCLVPFYYKNKETNVSV